MTREEEKQQKINDYLNTFMSEAGKRVLEDLKKGARYNQSYVPKGNDGHIDALEMARQEGKRSVIVHIELMLKKE